IIEKQWIDMPNQYNNVELDQFMIMPNHIHGIIIINKRTGASPVPTISNIIGSFKSKTSVEYLRYINDEKLNISGQIWQRSFHDHIIRTDKS
ncbi:MAG: transposase, partial [Candidatus Omnitrophota bacterium]